MKKVDIPERKRQRAPSRRSLETRARILDSAERQFAERGFEGASIREIATGAGTQVGLVHHHGEGKEELFRQVVARRADELSSLRLSALEARKSDGSLDLSAIMTCFFEPYIAMASRGDPQWLAYARLVAHVSADPRWRDISLRHFDATAMIFIDEIARLYPKARREQIAAGFVYSVAAMLALVTSRWRVGALSKDRDGCEAGRAHELAELVRYCAAGIAAAVDG